jgi:hypothetical protein
MADNMADALRDLKVKLAESSSSWSDVVASAKASTQRRLVEKAPPAEPLTCGWDEVIDASNAEGARENQNFKEKSK